MLKPIKPSDIGEKAIEAALEVFPDLLEPWERPTNDCMRRMICAAINTQAKQTVEAPRRHPAAVEAMAMDERADRVILDLKHDAQRAEGMRGINFEDLPTEAQA